ncbi:MAG: AEC family transporter, partial [Gammaproteobacteria bacterium]|nr:AEC family transporter [Gammaproteobacteria bacterium]
MDQVIGVALPLFAIILCGYIARKKQLLNEVSTTGLVNLVYYFLLPAFLFIKTMSSTLHQGLDWRLLGSFYGAGAIIFIIALVSGRMLYRHSRVSLAIRGLAAISSNTGYMGMPLVILAFGSAAIAPAVAIVVFDNILVLIGGSLLMEITQGKQAHWKQALMQVLHGIPRNPIIMSVPLALVLLIANISLPQPLRAFGELLSNAAIACALFALGATLAIRTTKVRHADVWQVIALKLLLHPLIVFLLARYVFALEPLNIKIAVTMATLPVAVNIYILASRYRAYVN